MSIFARHLQSVIRNYLSVEESSEKTEAIELERSGSVLHVNRCIDYKSLDRQISERLATFNKPSELRNTLDCLQWIINSGNFHETSF